MSTTTPQRQVRSLYVFIAASVLIHALLLAVPFKSAVVSKTTPPLNRLIAVELLIPEQKTEKTDAKNTNPAPPLPRPQPQKTLMQKPKPRPVPSSQKPARTKSREASVSLDRLSDSDVQYRSYLGHVRSKIDAVWEYPPAARDNGLNGVVTVRFTIARNGRLEALIVKNKSPYQLLDDEALRTIRAAAPFLPFPSEFSIETLHVSASFEYEFSGR